jgi:hypothetical protein
MIETPNMKRIVARGLMHTNVRTTALCALTRSWLLIGRNHTAKGMACIAQAFSGPNSNGHISMDCAAAAKLRGERGRLPGRPGTQVQHAVEAVEALYQGGTADPSLGGDDREGRPPVKGVRDDSSGCLGPGNSDASSRDRVLQRIRGPVLSSPTRSMSVTRGAFLVRSRAWR